MPDTLPCSISLLAFFCSDFSNACELTALFAKPLANNSALALVDIRSEAICSESKPKDPVLIERLSAA